MIHFNVFPGGKRRIVTFSYDDGVPNDERLVKLFDKYGVKGTFHLNTSRLEERDDKIEYYRNRYKGHEISCHTYHHGLPTLMPYQTVVNEVMEDRRALEEIAQYPVVGMSYPFADYNDKIADIMRMCGIVYSRTTKPTMAFKLPDDFLKWHPTCHHDLADKVVDGFLDSLDVFYHGPIFYIWGHSYEFRTEEDWTRMENIVKKLSGNDKIWYATNIEIYNYVMAQRQLKISVDEKTFYNPSAIDVWVDVDKGTIVHIPAGQTVTVK